MTTGSGDSRSLGGGPLLGGAAKASRTRSSSVKSDDPLSADASTTVTPVPEVSAPQRRPMTVGTAPITRKKGRRARLTVKRIDPWTTLKFSFVYGLAGMIVLLVSVVVLYSIVDAMGVITSLRNLINDVGTTGVTGSTTNPDNTSSLIVWLSFSRVMLVAIVIGLINVVLFTAFATLTAFIYNVCTDIVGGVEVTLAERN